MEDPAHAFARTLDDARTTVLLDPRRDFGAVYEAHYQQIFKAVRGVVLDATLAEDITQDAFVKAYQARDNYRPTGRVEAWLCTIAIREAISRLRWTALQRRLVAFWQRDIERQVSGEGLPERVDELLAVLSPKTRALVVLHFLHGYRYREIAAILGLRERTVARRLSQALAQMRRLRSRIDEGDDGERFQGGAR